MTTHASLVNEAYRALGGGMTLLILRVLVRVILWILGVPLMPYRAMRSRFRACP